MQINEKRLDECCQIELSSIDKKSKPNEKSVKLCNFTDVYSNWNIYPSMIDSFMGATTSDSNIQVFSLKKGDVVITKDSETREDIGMSAYIADDMPNTVLGYHCALIRPNNDIDGAYLNAFLNSSVGKKFFANQASGSGQRYTLTKDAIGSIKIPIIELPIQKKIGSFFSLIDKHLVNNNYIVKNLVDSMKLNYEYWFIQFDFPDKDGNPYKSSGGKMIWDQNLKRNIPEGWESRKIGQLLSRVPRTGSIPRALYTNGTKYPIVDQSKNFICGYTDDDSKVLNIENAIVFGDHTNYSKYINFKFARGADGTQIIISNEPRISNYLLYLQICSLPVIEEGYSRHFKFLKERYVLIPKLAVSQMYDKKIEKSLEMMKTIYEENRQLISLRDFILPMVLNGQASFKS